MFFLFCGKADTSDKLKAVLSILFTVGTITKKTSSKTTFEFKFKKSVKHSHKKPNIDIFISFLIVNKSTSCKSFCP